MNWLTIALWILGGVIGIAVLAFCIQNRKRILLWLAARRAARATARVAVVATGTPTPKAKTGDGFKKVIETGIALGKLTSLLAITGVLFVFIIGPTKFWGQPMVIQHVPTQWTQPSQVAMKRTLIAPHGNTNAPPEKWSEKVERVNGLLTDWNVVGQKGRLAILEDEKRVIIAEPDSFVRTEGYSLRFITLNTNQSPLQINIVQRLR